MKPFQNAAAWSVADMQNTSNWQYTISQQDVAEINEALRLLKQDLPSDYHVTQQQFPLPTLAVKLQSIQQELEHGRGIFLLRGLPVEQYTADDIRWVYAGLSAYIGALTSQSREGELVHDVGDCGKRLTERSGRGTTTSDPLPFHTDRCDVVSLLCLQQSVSGGQSRVASALAVHNAMLKQAPELLELLYAPFYHARAAWEVEGEDSVYQLPIFSICNGYPACRYLRHFITMAQQLPGVPKLTAQQIQALDLFETLVSSPTYCLDMDFLPGDIQFLNNFVSLHSRAGYVDDPARKRHLLRLWMSVPNSRPLVEAFRPLYREVAAGKFRGGLPQPREALV